MRATPATSVHCNNGDTQIGEGNCAVSEIGVLMQAYRDRKRLDFTPAVFDHIIREGIQILLH